MDGCNEIDRLGVAEVRRCLQDIVVEYSIVYIVVAALVVMRLQRAVSISSLVPKVDLYPIRHTAVGAVSHNRADQSIETKRHSLIR